MAIRTGLNAQLGVALETTFGTYVAPARWFEFTAESITREQERMESKGIRAGTRVLRSDRWVLGKKTIGGDMGFEVVTSGLGVFLEHAMGDVVTVNDLATAFTHTFTPGDLPVGFTAQVGIPDTTAAGTVHPFSWTGCQIEAFKIRGAVDEIGEFGITIVAQEETTAQTLGAPTYPTNEPLGFVEASLEIAASPVDVRAVEFNGANNLVTGRHKLGTPLAEEALEGSDLREYTGTIDAHFETLAAYNRFVNGTEAALDFKFEGAVIETGHPFTLQVLANVRFDGETPQVSGMDEVVQNLPYKVVDESALSIVYKTTDATP